jgi:hypothetical protein
MIMETVSTFETSVSFYQTTRHNIPEDTHLHTRRLENPKSNLKVLLSSLHEKKVDSTRNICISATCYAECAETLQFNVSVCPGDAF